MERKAEINNSRLSIIIATFNSGQFLQACLDSIHNQRIKDIEIVLVDGKSTDDTISIIKANAAPNLKWISESDKGTYDAFNKGVTLATGKWIYFLGSDDRLRPEFSDLVDRLKDTNTVYYGNSIGFCIGDNKPAYDLYEGEFDKYRLAKCCMNHQAIIYPATVFKKYAYDLKYKIAADYDLNIKVWGDDFFKKEFYNLTIVNYHLNGLSSLSTDRIFKQDKPERIKQSMGWFIYARYMYKKYKHKRKGLSDFD
ncbi:glycosyltransferase family 2 protein [Spirosoma sp.]|uniref:glycosyltransferase family 2 protein n=1 Tax=Spirosoma sp. TaxID=1899569 RepID=UPI003B39FC00